MGDIITNYDSQVGKFVTIIIEELKLKKQGLETKIEAQEGQISILKKQHHKISEENTILKKQMSKLGGTLEMLKKDAKNSKGTFDSYQNVFIQEREELLGIIKMKVSYFLV